MSKNSSISWTTHTWNPVTGCTRVSPGCDNCYAMRIAEHYGVRANAASQRTSVVTIWTGKIQGDDKP